MAKSSKARARARTNDDAAPLAADGLDPAYLAHHAGILEVGVLLDEALRILMG